MQLIFCVLRVEGVPAWREPLHCIEAAPRTPRRPGGLEGTCAPPLCGSLASAATHSFSIAIRH